MTFSIGAFRLGIIAALLSSGCATGAQKKLQGRWLGEEINNLDAAQLAAATGWVKGTSFEFSGGSVTVTIPTELPRTGPYEVENTKETDVQIAIRNPNGALDRVALTLVSDNQLRWHIGQGRSILMRRVD